MTARARLWKVCAELFAFQQSDRPWLMPFAAALAVGLPLVTGTQLGRPDHGAVAALGGLVFLHLTDARLSHRMVMLMACAFGMIACYALGVVSQLVQPLMMAALTLVATLVTMVCRFYRVGPPGSLFFVMAAAVGAYSPVPAPQVPYMIGLFAMGCLLAALIAFGYSLYMLTRRPAVAPAAIAPPGFDFVVVDSIIIGCSVGLALLLAQGLSLKNAYWVPVSCLAVIQGIDIRAIWQRQVQRIVGTLIGVSFAMLLLAVARDAAWAVAPMIMVLVVIAETAIVRHYALAVIFITPLTILIAEAATRGSHPAAQLIEARLFDTVLGSLVGLLGGVVLHNARIRRFLVPPLRRRIHNRIE